MKSLTSLPTKNATSSPSTETQTLQPSKLLQACLLLLSLLLVSFGQPAFYWWCGLLAAVGGYALFWRVLICYNKPKKRFWLATAWFTAVQLIQLSWFYSHPYYYIYPIIFLLALAEGIQFGLISLLVDAKHIDKIKRILLIAALWTLFEWSRLFVLAGFSWNPVGLSLTGSIYAMQFASLFGIYGLSFWVILVNLLLFRSWKKNWSAAPVALWLIAASAPYLYGSIQLYRHEALIDQHPERLNVVLVNTNFPAEETANLTDPNAVIAYVVAEWTQILEGIKKHHGQPIDLMLFPECIVPFGTYTSVYPLETVQSIFEKTLGPESLHALPAPKSPYARRIQTLKGEIVLVNNAFWAQGLANFFQVNLLIGLEDAEDIFLGKREFYSGALYFSPLTPDSTPMNPPAARYEKRILVPLGEYIPFDFCKELAARYGVQGSFVHGKEAKVFMAGKVPFGISICYEETFGHIMRESKQLGANLLVNLTSDVWYPNSLLPQQHFDHARLRSVENGIPLIRSCNMGLSGGVDSLGRVIGLMGPDGQEVGSADAIRLSVSVYNYQTLYSRFGDYFVIGFCLVIVLAGLILTHKSKTSNS
jgi:apolipoprotein N-acyltransferase